MGMPTSLEVAAWLQRMEQDYVEMKDTSGLSPRKEDDGASERSMGLSEPSSRPFTLIPNMEELKVLRSCAVLNNAMFITICLIN